MLAEPSVVGAEASGGGRCCHSIDPLTRSEDAASSGHDSTESGVVRRIRCTGETVTLSISGWLPCPLIALCDSHWPAVTGAVSTRGGRYMVQSRMLAVM